MHKAKIQKLLKAIGNQPISGEEFFVDENQPVNGKLAIAAAFCYSWLGVVGTKLGDNDYCYLTERTELQ